MISIHPDVIKRLREFAQEPGALFLPLKSSAGSVPIWADDINATTSDEELRQLVAKAFGKPLKPSADGGDAKAADAKAAEPSQNSSTQ